MRGVIAALLLLLATTTPSWAGSTGVIATNVAHLTQVTQTHYRFYAERPSEPQFKIIFGWRAFYNPSVLGPWWVYLIETNLWSFRWADTVVDCLWGTGSIADWGAAGYDVAVPDYQFQNPLTGMGRIGERVVGEETERDFTRAKNGTIDGIPGLTKIGSLALRDLSNRSGSVTLARVGFVTNPGPEWGFRFASDSAGGYLCTAAVPSGSYYIWRVTTVVEDANGNGSVAYVHEVLLPEAHGRYIRPDWLMEWETEFLSWPGVWRTYFWDMWAVDDTHGKVPLRDFLVHFRGDGGNPNPHEHWGVKAATFQGHDALEISSDGVSQYLGVGGTLQLQESGPPVTIPTLSGRSLTLLGLLFLVGLYAQLQQFSGD